MKYAIPIVIIVLALLGANGIYVVGEGHAAVLTRMGRIVAAGVGPGLHFKLPFVQDVTVYDARELSSQAEPGDLKTRDDQAVRVGFDMLWQVADPATYYKATAGDELRATQAMDTSIRDVLRKQVAGHDLSTLLVASNGDVGAAVRNAVAGDLRSKLGVDVLAIGIGRVLPSEDALPAVYKRMTAEAQAQAGSVHAEGEAAAAAIHAQGDAEDQQVLAKANQEAAVVRGEGDAAAAKIYATASAQDPQFFSYWSSLETWRKSFSGGGAVIVLDKDSPFMRAVDAGAVVGDAAAKKQ